jgi:hypothetical protein
MRPIIFEYNEGAYDEDDIKDLIIESKKLQIALLALDSISSGFGENKHELENYAEGKLIEIEKFKPEITIDVVY